MDKKVYMLAMTVGSFLGSYVPLLWGSTDTVSMSSVLCAAAGGLLGIYGAYRLLQ